ncbi:unnamed protein product, partial [Vitis vinifera]
MERGSSSLTVSSSSANSSESLNGLKFGQKIYFEDLGKVRGSGVVQGGQPPRCQVEGCKVDLSDAKAYYSRHKVCGMHSKSPTVIVAGLEQRFCQQCSRFHQLAEFDQGKRSCRRRLAGHNERRRKPPPGSLLSSRYGRLSSSIFENSSRVGGGFLMDFAAYPRHPERDTWPTTRASDRVPGNQTTAMGRFLPHPWQSNSENPLFLQGSAGGTSFHGPGIPSGECFTGASDSSCALSLLSNQPWSSRNRASGLGANSFMNPEGASMAQPTAPHSAAINHFPSTSWDFKGNEGSSSSQEMPPDLGLGQISQPINSQFSGGGELPQQSGRQYMELEHSRAYDSSTQQMHWSL